MASPEQFEKLLQGAKAWNLWREENLWITPDLSSANIHRAKLSGMNRQEQWRKVLDAEVLRWSAQNYEQLISELCDLQARRC